MLDTGFVGVHAGRYHVEARLQEMPPPGVGRPAVVEGTADGLLFERSFARRLGVGPGDTVTFDTRSGPRSERITGLAVVYDQEAFPFSQPGATFGSKALLDALAPQERFVLEYVRLADPDCGARRRRPAAGGRGRAAGDRRGRLAAAARGRQ